MFNIYLCSLLVFLLLFCVRYEMFVCCFWDFSVFYGKDNIDSVAAAATAAVNSSASDGSVAFYVRFK